MADNAAKGKKKKTVSAAFILIILALAIVWVYSNMHIETTYYTASSSEIGKEFDGFTIVQLSDLHSASFGNKNSKLISAIEAQEPDIVVMTGDMVSSADTDYTTFYSLAEKLAKEYDVYYVVGNHELVKGEGEVFKIEEKLRSLGVNVIDNESLLLTRGNSSVRLYGLWFNLRYYADITDNSTGERYYFDNDKISTILGNANKSEYNILLTHNPVYFKTYSSWGADLVLSGHMHGGMIRIPFVGGLLSPEEELFPEYDSGEFTEGSSQMFVNRGLGNMVFGLRFLNCPEVSVITLQSK